MFKIIAWSWQPMDKKKTSDRYANNFWLLDCLTDSTIKNTGISTCIQLSQKFSHVSMLKARNKIDRNLFYTINKHLHQSSFLNNYIYAIDGSKVPVMPVVVT